MSHYRLKKGPVIQVADGPMRGEIFAPGREYDRIPETMAGLFTLIRPTRKRRKRKSGVDDEITTD